MKIFNFNNKIEKPGLNIFIIVSNKHLQTNKVVCENFQISTYVHINGTLHFQLN